MLTESECARLEAALTQEAEPRRVAAYLCLHMGLTVAEASALRLYEIDLNEGFLYINNALTRVNGPGGARFQVLPLAEARRLPLLPYVGRYIRENLQLYSQPDCFVVNGSVQEPGAHLLQNLMASLNSRYDIADSLTANMLRGAFIRRCFENGLDIYTVGRFVGIKHLQELENKYGRYIRARFEEMGCMEKYAAGYKPPMANPESGRRMNLLILGAGSQGPVVKEIAEALGVFRRIDYLDDDPNKRLAIDCCDNYKRYAEVYPIAIPSFGDNRLRELWTLRLEAAGFILPTLIHPMATISPSAAIGPGTVVEAKAIVSTNTRIGKGCIISSGAIVDINAQVEAFAHVDSAATLTKNVRVEAYRKIPSGRIVEN